MQYLTKDELIDVLAKARAHSERNYLMILVAFSHGLRATEVVSLTPDNFADGYLTIQRLKGSNKTIQPLIKSDNDLLNEADNLFAYMQSRTGRLFPISRVMFWKYMQRYCAEAGIPKHKRHPHVLKHTCAKLALSGNMRIDQLKQYLGHKNLSSTGEYLKDDDETASKAFAMAIGGSK